MELTESNFEIMNQFRVIRTGFVDRKLSYEKGLYNG